MGRRKHVLIAFAAIAVCAPTLGHAQAIGTHFSGPTDADETSSFWNPAATTLGTGTQVGLGLGGSLIRVGYDSPETPGASTASAPKPEGTIGGFSDALGDNWRIGFTLGVPYVAGARWNRNDAEGDVTRYYAAKSTIFHVMATPSIAYRINDKLAFGIGFHIVYSRLIADFDKDLAVQLNRSVGSSSTDSPFPSGSPELAAPVAVDTAGVGFGGSIGFVARPMERVLIGASVHSPVKSRTRGSVDVSYPADMIRFVREAVPGAELPELAGDAEISLDLPLAIYGAVSVDIAPMWDARVDYRYLDYSKTTNTDVLITNATSTDLMNSMLVRGRNDRHSIGLRVIRSLPESRADVAMMARYEDNYVAEPTYTPSNMNFSKIEVGAALRWQMTDKLSLISHYSHFFLPDVVVDESLHRPVAVEGLDAFNHPSPTGRYSGAADQLMVAVSLTCF